jgi:hypothetical protein
MGRASALSGERLRRVIRQRSGDLGNNPIFLERDRRASFQRCPGILATGSNQGRRSEGAVHGGDSAATRRRSSRQRLAVRRDGTAKRCALSRFWNGGAKSEPGPAPCVVFWQQTLREVAGRQPVGSVRATGRDSRRFQHLAALAESRRNPRLPARPRHSTKRPNRFA